MVKKLTELVDVEVGKDLDGIALFEATVKYEPLNSERGGIAMSSGCVSCNNGGGGGSGGTLGYTKDEKPYRE